MAQNYFLSKRIRLFLETSKWNFKKFLTDERSKTKSEHCEKITQNGDFSELDTVDHKSAML